MKKFTKKEIFDIIQIGDKSNITSRLFDLVIVINIFANISVVFLSTFDKLSQWHGLFRGIEIATTVFFILEYILRIWTADLLYTQASKSNARLRFLVSFDGIVDLFTILPTFFLSGFVVFRMFRVVRIFHLFRLNNQYDSFNIITTVLYEKRNQIISSVFIVLTLMLASSLCMYSVEHDAQPEVFSNAFSGMWWSVNTLLTVGYGDIYPVTIIGRIMAIVISFLGVGVVAIPTGIISAGFVEQYQRKADITNYREVDLAEIVELRVDKEYAGKSIGEIRKSQRLEILLVLRDNMSILPQNDFVLKTNDIIVARSKEA